MLQNNFILKCSGALQKQKCDLIINFFEKNTLLHRQGLVGEKLDPTRKKSTDLFLSKSDWIYSHFKEQLNDSIKKYKNKYPFIDNGLIHWNISNGFKIQRYNPKEGYFYLHCENDGYPGQIQKRVLSWMIYLNDVKDGGYTEFPYQNKKIQPRCGDIIIWPAYFTHPHRGIKSNTQTKYIVTGWCEFI